MNLKIAKDFSRIPGTRYPDEGNYSGEDFREKFLYPKLREAMRNNEKLIVDLDGTAGIGTSFLEEAFGGLVRIKKMDYKTLCESMELISNDDPDYKEEIWLYIKNADEQKRKDNEKK